MLQIQRKMGPKGQIVIPKVIRESLGLTENQPVLMELQDKELRLRLAPRRNVVEEWREIAKKEGMDVSKKVKYGSALYREIFS